MKTKGRLVRYVSILVSILFLMQSAPLYAASMEDYCIVPPYVKRDVAPNILILMDNSQIMLDKAYGDTYDPSDNTTYTGYFIPEIYYRYDTNRFVPDQNGAFKGELLNWATTSRYDLLQSILVGGKSRSRVGDNIHTLVSMSNTWTKTYSSCIFQVNNGNLTITEATPNACVLLDTPRTRLTYNKPEETINVASLEDNSSVGALNVFFEAINSALGLFSTEAFAAPLRISNINNQTITQGAGFSLTVVGNGGGGLNYQWSATGIPAGLSINPTGTPITYISGTPTTAGVYSVTITLTEGALAPDTETFTITVSAATANRSEQFNVWVCYGNYTDNCAVGTPPPKEGIVDMFWDRARFGLEDFSQSGDTISPNYPSGTSCIPASPKASFLTNIENATPVGDASNLTPLVNGAYTAVDYYKNNTDTNCNPFANSQPCLKNFILMITAGEGADIPPPPPAGMPSVFSDATHCSDTTIPKASYNLSKNTCYGYNNDLRTDETTYPGKQYVSTYIVNTMGVNGTILSEAANASGGNYYPVTDAAQLRQQLIQAFQDIIKRAAAGTAASVLASGEGSGANLLQAVFYPRKKFFNSTTSTFDEIAWTGRLQNLWYYVDPYFTYSNIRDDSTHDYILNLKNDRIAQLFFNTTTEATMANLYDDTEGDGAPDSLYDTVVFENLKYLWEAGLELWKRDLPSSPRTIYTSCISGGTCIGSTGLMLFSHDVASNVSALRPYLDLPTTDLYPVDSYKDGDLDRVSDVDDTDANILIRYIHGYDFPNTDFPTITWLRSRTVAIDLSAPPDGDTLDAGEGAKVWKLNDVLNSTPKISSWLPLNTYNKVYTDSSYGLVGADAKLADPADPTHFLTTANYKSRGMVFAGANDGMLHAFNLGSLELSGSWKTEDWMKAKLAGTDLGKEIWAFIPKNALPYLKYIKEPGYCHVFTVDLTPFVFDASINNPAGCAGNYWECDKDVSSWRTILIGGMRFGGACKGTTTACADVSGDGSKDCVNTPVDVGGTSVGYSSYFALDVTDQNNPTLLWEFSNENLGFTTTGPAVVRIGSTDKNGKWFVVFGSGPTGPVSTTDQQFMGRSDQSLKLFVLDLKTGALLRTFGDAEINIPYAFAGSMLNSTMDSDLDYQDDAVYIGYVKRTGTSPNFTWTDGGVGRLVTKENIDPANWTWSRVMDGIGPVNSSIVHLQDKKRGILWLFFGTGRYFYEKLTTVDDETGRRQVFGIKEPCFSSSGFDSNCTDQRSFCTTPVTSSTCGDLTNVTDILDVPSESTANSASFYGWYINLDPSGGAYRAERAITDPLATTSGLVFFTTYAPYIDVCSYGGKSYIWAVKYSTGGGAAALLKGKALLQVSTGSIEQVNLSTAFTEKGGRRTSAMEGVPPTAQGLSILSTPPPVKRAIHMRER